MQDIVHAPHGLLDGLDIEEIAFNYFCAEGSQMLGPIVDPVHEGPNMTPLLEQYFRYVHTGLALPAAGRSGY